MSDDLKPLTDKESVEFACDLLRDGYPIRGPVKVLEKLKSRIRKDPPLQAVMYLVSLSPDGEEFSMRVRNFTDREYGEWLVAEKFAQLHKEEKG